ncbi:MAG: hypothetical protein GTO02_18485 [Candidatus Dadabacteria bacterium]|nr:hypothetical protein [Candidatus Dadabacteria bacterium]NIQ16300.1 hypothetical protein [Candidatus Dadabacteria bacterium]
MASFDIDEMLKDVPPEYRQQAKEMMQKRMPKQVQNGTVAKPDLKKIGSENYNGYPSTKYILNNKNEEKIHLWVTNWNNVKGGKEISDAFINLGKFFDDLIEATSKISQGFNQDNNNYMRILDDVNGFIHSSKTYENGNLESETRLKNSYKRSVSLSEFSSPYTCKNPMSQL